MWMFISKKRDSPEVVKARTALQELAAVEWGTDFVGRVAAEITAPERLARWTEVNHLKEGRGIPCIWRLTERRCRHEGVDCQLPGSDHSTLWLRDGKPVVWVTQPYHLSMESLTGLVEFCNAHNLRIELSAALSWHFPGATLAVIVSKGPIPPPSEGQEEAE